MDVEARLRDAGYRSTRPRRAVWTVLCSAERHLTVEEVHQRLHEAGQGIDLASVYRSLAVLAELGLASEVRAGADRGHWEVAHDEDALHLRCMACGRIDHHPADAVAEVLAHLEDRHGFAVDDVEVVVRGTCRGCRAGAAAVPEDQARAQSSHLG